MSENLINLTQLHLCTHKQDDGMLQNPAGMFTKLSYIRTMVRFLVPSYDLRIRLVISLFLEALLN